MDSLLKIVKESGINFAGSLIGKILNYIWLIIITRFLTPEEFGTFTLAQSIIYISLIFVLFGSPNALDRFIPFYNAQGEQGKIKTLVSKILKITLSLSLIAGGILFFESGFISYTIFKKPDLYSIIKIMVISIPLLSFIQIVTFSFIGFKELRYPVYFQEIFFPIIKIVFALVILFFGYGLIEWTGMYVLSLVGTALFAIILFKKKIISIFIKVKKQSISFGKIFSYSWPLSVVGLISFLLSDIGFIFLGTFRSSSEIGVYRIYISLVLIIQIFLSSLASIYKPVISEYISKDKIDDIKNIYMLVSRWYIAVTLVGFVVVLVLGKSIVEILFTHNYVIAPVGLYILASTHLINSLTGPDEMTLQAFGNTKLSMVNNIVMLIIYVALCYSLIPSMGIIGAAIALAVATGVNHLAGLLEIYILYKMNPFSFVHLKYFFAAVLSGGIGYFLSFSLSDSDITKVIIILFIIIAVYFGILFFLKGFSDTDLELIRFIKSRSSLLFRAKNTK